MLQKSGDWCVPGYTFVECLETAKRRNRKKHPGLLCPAIDSLGRAQGRLINCFRSIISRDKSSRLQVVARLVSEEIERRPLPPLLRDRARIFTYTHTHAYSGSTTLAKLGGKIEKLVPSRLTPPDLDRGTFVDVSAAVKPEEAPLDATENRFFLFFVFFLASVVIIRLSEFDSVMQCRE